MWDLKITFSVIPRNFRKFVYIITGLFSNFKMECFQIYFENSNLTLLYIATNKIFVTSFETKKLNINDIMLGTFKYNQDLKNILSTHMLMLFIFKILGYIIIVSHSTTEAVSIVWYTELSQTSHTEMHK